MKKTLQLVICFAVLISGDLFAQNGYYDAPYVRYEADAGTLTNASATSKSHAQYNLQSEASEQVCVNMTAANASVAWTVSNAGDGLTIRYSVPDGESGAMDVFVNNVDVGDLNLTSYYSWEYLSSNGNSNNVGVTNTNPKMRFDEVHIKLSSIAQVGQTLKLVRKSGNIHLDFAELELVPGHVGWVSGDVTYTGNGSDLQNFIDGNGGKTIYLPAGSYTVGRELYFGNNNTTLKGAGMWHTNIYFSNNNGGQGGLRANASNVSYSGMYLNTVRNSRSGSYKGINGVYTSGSTISNLWVEHFECGAWIGQYNSGGPAIADGFKMSHCRFRNNYADGSNLCKGTSNAIVEHCSYRNNGDDDMAIWSANGQECANNTFRYNTSENTWRASGCAIYGGYSNKAQNLLIKDNVEVGIKVNNAFGGAPFNGGGMHELTNITIKRCGTYNDLFMKPVGAIDLGCYNNGAGTQVRNVKFSCIDISDSRNDAIYIKKAAGDGFYNIVFENITINGTGREFPDNGGNITNRGYMVLFKGNPAGNISYCGMNYSNRGGSATYDVNTNEQGGLSWTQAGTCPGGCTIPSTSSVTITSASYFGVCNKPATFTATSTPPSGNTVNSIQFYVDNVSIGSDNSSPYSVDWANPTAGSHQVKAVASFSGGSTSTSLIQTVNVVANAVYSTSTAPVIDGTIDAMWSSYTPLSLDIVSVGSVSNASDLSANYRIARDNTNLYILVDVTDDVLRNDGTANWEKDAVEIFIDMGNDKASSYVANNDFQWTFVYNVSTAQPGLTFKQGAKTGGYIMEIMIPWSTLGGVPAANSFIGFDLHVDDDDDGTTRDAKKAWFDATDKAWQSPSVLGTLQIAGCALPATSPVADFSFTPSSACTGQTVTFTDGSTNTPTSWDWNFGPGATPATANTKGPHTVVYSSTGTKSVSLIAGNSAGSNSTSRSMNIITTPGQPGTISGSASPCSGTSVTYSISAVSGAISYTWSLPNGWTGSSTTASITTTVSATSGNVSVTANNSCGSSSPKTLSVTPLSVPAQPGTINGAASVCNGASSVYSISPVSGATSYSWILPSGWSGSSTSENIVALPSSSSGNVSVAASNVCGTSSSKTRSVTTTSIPAQPGSISGSASACVGSQVTYGISAVSEATSYTWTLPNGWSGSSTTINITATLGSSSGIVKVIATNSCGSSPEATLSVTSATAPAKPGSITGLTKPCSGSATTYSVSAVAGTTFYTWSLPNGWTGSSASRTISATPGTESGTISIVANNACGASLASTLAVTSNSTPSQPIAINGPTFVTPGSTNGYSISAVSGATSYIWTLPSGWSGNSTTADISIVAGTSGGSISVSAANSCGNSVAKMLAINVGSVPPAPDQISGPSVVNQGDDNVTYSVTKSAGITYIWTFEGTDAIISGTGNEISLNFGANATSGNLNVTATNSFGNSTASTLSITVNPMVITGLNTIAGQGKISVYPNPASSSATLKIDSDLSGNCDVAIYDILGNEVKIVLKNEPLNESIRFSVADMVPGVYFVKLKSGNRAQVLKFVRQE